MKINEYQEKCLTTADYAAADYPLALLVEEVGEVFGKIAKFSRKWGVSIEDVVEIIYQPSCPAERKLRSDVNKELGDAFWSLMTVMHRMGFKAEDVAQANLDKLADRKKRGVICGQGDNR